MKIVNTKGQSQMMEVLDMLSDICMMREELLGSDSEQVADARFASALAHAHVGYKDQAG